MKLKKLRNVVAWMILGSGAAQADMLGLRLGADYLDLNPEYQVGDSGFSADFALKNQRDVRLFARLEHPVPLLPELAVRYHRSNLRGQQRLAQAARLGGTEFVGGQLVELSSKVTQLDFVAYYELLDNPLLSLDAGGTIRQLNADMSWQSSSRQASADMSVLIPMLYLDAELAVWGTSTFLFAGGNYSRYQGDLNYDWQAGVAWQVIDITMFQLLLKAGWQQAEQLSNKRDQLDFSARYSGAFVGLSADF